MGRPKTAIDYQRLGVRHGFRWLGPMVRNTKCLTKWCCHNNHEFSCCYNNLQRGQACKICGRAALAMKQRHTPSRYERLAKRRGIVWLGPPVTSALSITMWACYCGCRWSARYNNIQQGHGCPACAVRRHAARHKKSHEDYHALARRRSFAWEPGPVGSSKHKTTWRCKSGHRFLSSYNLIQQGKGCPYCAGLARKSAGDSISSLAIRGLLGSAKQSRIPRLLQDGNVRSFINRSRRTAASIKEADARIAQADCQNQTRIIASWHHFGT